MEKLCFTKQNIAFEWKNFVLQNKKLLFKKTEKTFEKQKNKKKTKKTKKTKDSNRIRMVLGGGHGFLSEAFVFLVFAGFLAFL